MYNDVNFALSTAISDAYELHYLKDVGDHMLWSEERLTSN